MGERYEVKDRVGRVLTYGTYEECVKFMEQFSDCSGPFPKGFRPAPEDGNG